MTIAYILFVLPVLLFVAAFLYETFLSFKRLKSPKAGRGGYLHATWEVTHTLLVFAVVMLVMLFTKSIDKIASTIFVSMFLAAAALAIRAVAYTYIFYVRKKPRTSWIDWTFAFSHVLAALFLVVTVLKSLIFLYKNNPPVNDQFYPFFIPGLIVVLAVSGIPILFLYRIRD